VSLPYVLRRTRAKAGKRPKPPPYVLTLTKPATFFGNSLTAGNISGTQYSFPSQLKPYVSGTVDNEGHGGDTPTQIADRVTNTDTTIYDPGAGLTRAQQVAGRGGLGSMRNAINSTIGLGGTTASILTQIARSVAALSADFYISIEPNADVEPAGIAGWAQTEWIRREIMRLYPTRAMDWYYLLAPYAADSSLDRGSLYELIVPDQVRRLTNGTVNSLHEGPVGNAAIAWDGAWRFLEGEENGGGWSPPYIKTHITGSAASTARTLNGHVFDTPYRNTAGTFTLVGGDTVNLAVNASTGEITNKTGANLGVVKAIVENRKGTVRNRCEIDMFIGASDTSCSDTFFYGKQGITMPDSPTSVDAQKGSFIFGVRMGPGTDGTSMFILGNEDSGKVTIERTTSNTIRLTGKNPSGTTVVSLTSNASGAGLVNEAAGLVWVAISFDINAATPTATMTVNGTDVLSATKTLTSGGTVNYSKRLIIGAQTMTRRAPFLGWLREFWMARDYIAWTTSARRDEVYNSSTLAAVNLPSDGAVNAIVPFFWLPGNDADKYWGDNRGTGGPSVAYILPGAPPSPLTDQPIDGSFTPTDLGAALVAWWNADDHGTANMTDDGAGLISAWKDRVGGLSLTATTTARPTWSATSFNASGASCAALTFDGTANCLTGTSFGSIPVSTTPGTIMVAGSGAGTADANSRFIIAYGGTAGGSQRRVGKNTADTAVGGDGTTQTSGGTLLNWLNEAIVSLDFAATTYTLAANGTVGTPTTGATLNTTATRIRIGASTATTAANFWKGMARHVFVTTALTTTQRQQLEGWIAWDCGLTGLLPATHPYKYARP